MTESIQQAIEAISEALKRVPTEAWEFGSYSGGEVRIGPVGQSKHEAFVVMRGRWSVPWDADEESRAAFERAAYIAACHPERIRALVEHVEALVEQSMGFA